VFGDVLPDTTSDEREPDPQDRSDAADATDGRATWLKDQVPPHHGPTG
jgi:hypothetical protein